MSSMSATEVVNAFVDMTGTEMNSAQRVALEKLLESIFQSGVDASKGSGLGPSDGCQCSGCQGYVIKDIMYSDIPHLGGEGMYCEHCRSQGPKCDECKALGPDLNLSEKDIEVFGGTGLYCAMCRLKAAKSIAKDIDLGSSVSGPVPICDRCKMVDPVEALNIEHSDIKSFGGPGMYCRFCRAVSESEDKSDKMKKCSGCDNMGLILKLDALRHFGGKGRYCGYCILTNQEKLREEGALT